MVLQRLIYNYLGENNRVYNTILHISIYRFLHQSNAVTKSNCSTVKTVNLIQSVCYYYYIDKITSILAPMNHEQLQAFNAVFNTTDEYQFTQFRE